MCAVDCLRSICQKIEQLIAGQPTPPAASIATPIVTTTSAAGATPAGRACVSISNVGVAPGTVNGQALAVGATVNFHSYSDPAAGLFFRIDSVSYDATGTTFLIGELP